MAVEAEIMALKRNIAVLEGKISRSQKLEYIEKEARDHFDLVEEGDLVFIFTDAYKPDKSPAASL